MSIGNALAIRQILVSIVLLSCVWRGGQAAAWGNIGHSPSYPLPPEGERSLATLIGEEVPRILAELLHASDVVHDTISFHDIAHLVAAQFSPAGQALLQGGRKSTYTGRCHRMAPVPLAIVAL